MTKSLDNRPLAADPALRRFDDIRELIANPANPTPLVRLNRVVASADFPLYLKLEWYNPFGSVKDRTALYLLKGMAERGELDGKDLVEPSSGNTGIALAALAALLGKKLAVTIPDGVPDEKKLILRMLGAEVWATPDDLCPVAHPKDGAIALAQSFVQGTATKGRYAMPYQYENPDNVRRTTKRPGPRSGSRPRGGSNTSSPVTAPAERSPARPATSRSRTRAFASLPSSRKKGTGCRG